MLLTAKLGRNKLQKKPSLTPRKKAVPDSICSSSSSCCCCSSMMTVCADWWSDTAASELLGGAAVYKRLLEDGWLRHGTGLSAHQSSSRDLSRVVTWRRCQRGHATTCWLQRHFEVIRRGRLRHCSPQDTTTSLTRSTSYTGCSSSSVGCW